MRHTGAADSEESATLAWDSRGCSQRARRILPHRRPVFSSVALLTAGVEPKRNQLGGPAATWSPSACLPIRIRAPVEDTDSDLAHHPSGTGGRVPEGSANTLGPAPLTNAGTSAWRNERSRSAVSGMPEAR